MSGHWDVYLTKIFDDFYFWTFIFEILIRDVFD